jgi:hypothetical protein
MMAMKRGRLILAGVLVLGGVIGIWRLRQSQDGAAVSPPVVQDAGKPEPVSGEPANPANPQEADPETPGVEVAPSVSRPPAPAPLPAPNPPSPQRQTPAAAPLPADRRPAPVVPEPAQAAVEALALNIREYRNRFGGNPVGNNAEIVREMDGGNAKGAAYLPSELRRLNGQGELIDEWGTPYFFHQESAKEMEIRSAGADRVMWTSDDIVAR